MQVPPPSIFSEATKSLSVVIPAYNEEDRLAVTLEDFIGYATGKLFHVCHLTLAAPRVSCLNASLLSCDRYLRRRRDKQGANFTFEIIIVDDGSRDNTMGYA